MLNGVFTLPAPETIREPYMVTIKPDGMCLYLSLDKPPNADMLHTAVEGYIEIVPYFNKLGESTCLAFCNEEGKIHGLRRNILAQALWREVCPSLAEHDHLVGAICIVVAPQSFLALM